MHVWLADTRLNRAAAEAFRANPLATHVGSELERGVTVFQVDPQTSPDEWCADIVSTVVEHHGMYSHDPPVSVIEVYGATPTAAIRVAFEAVGFEDFQLQEGGFVARRAAG